MHGVEIVEAGLVIAELDVRDGASEPGVQVIGLGFDGRLGFLQVGGRALRGRGRRGRRRHGQVDQRRPGVCGQLAREVALAKVRKRCRGFRGVGLPPDAAIANVTRRPRERPGSSREPSPLP